METGPYSSFFECCEMVFWGLRHRRPVGRRWRRYASQLVIHSAPPAALAKAGADLPSSGRACCASLVRRGCRSEDGDLRPVTLPHGQFTSNTIHQNMIGGLYEERCNIYFKTLKEGTFDKCLYIREN